MADELAVSFDDLVEHRRYLQEFCRGQLDGICAFKRGSSFQVHLGEPTWDLDGAHHLSSSATCHESLICYSQRPKAVTDRYGERDAKNFVELALQRKASDWKSDGSAPIYCRCRTLPLVIRLISSGAGELERDIGIVLEHIRTILKQTAEPDRLAIGEAPGAERNNWYPPNAYHTFWTLLILEEFVSRFNDQASRINALLKPKRPVERLRSEMLVWARKTIGFEVGLHAADSPMADSDQLAWAMTIEFWFGGGVGADVEQQEFLRLGLKCLFNRQNSIGIWRRGRPLFHYERAGNAYCYVFETFTVLLGSALSDRSSAPFLRDAFKPYAKHLLRLWQYAVSTRLPLETTKASAWSSGHRSNRKDPESWATASVYSYANCLRRLLGVWTREAAAKDLPVKSQHLSEAQAVSKIVERGDTWSQSDENVATKLVTIFVNPVLSKDSSPSFEPDHEHIEENQARGAILFGPPGTSKTTLARAIAAALGWDYVELHASHFVADGLGEVQRTADRIFKRLMQLDRTVILFDEIDELVREREAKSDTFGRFLTTSMLPKLAELWDRRSVIYFVATNHIDYFDSAIVRAQRFDAIVHVPPPSFDRKLTRLRELLETQGITIPINVRQSSVEEALRNLDVTDSGDDKKEEAKGKAPLEDSQTLAKFLLIRWDQLDELAANIIRAVRAGGLQSVDDKSLNAALQQMRDPFLDKAFPYIRYMRSVEYERRDYSKVIVWEVDPGTSLKNVDGVRLGNNRKWYDTYDFRVLPPGFSVLGVGRIGVKDNGVGPAAG